MLDDLVFTGKVLYFVTVELCFVLSNLRFSNILFMLFCCNRLICFLFLTCIVLDFFLSD